MVPSLVGWLTHVVPGATAGSITLAVLYSLRGGLGIGSVGLSNAVTEAFSPFAKNC